MITPIIVDNEEKRRRFVQVPGFRVAPEVLARQGPDALWLLECQDRPAARCALWWKESPPLESQRLGLVGHYYADGPAAGAKMLDLACTELAGRGCTLAVGPMDGNTWQRYRFITDRGTEPTFFLEPDNPDDWPDHFTSAGFAPLAHYFSAVTDELTNEDARLATDIKKLQPQGICIRHLRPDQLDAELRRIYTLSRESFRDNFLYTPIAEHDFFEQYRDMEQFVMPELVILAEKADKLVAFLFCIPDLLQKQRGRSIDTVIVKTMATHPHFRGTGLGSVLMASCHATVRRLGFRRVIHALMHEDNHSRKISRHSARVFRRYTLFARKLQNRV
jgi:GNAT superfamily N-acetyltransferase